MVVDLAAVRRACAAQLGRPTEGVHDIAAYLDRQVADETARAVVGPLLPGTGASGVVVHRGETIGSWGDPAVPEMLFSATKSFVGLVAGVAHDRGLLDLDGLVRESVDLVQFYGRDTRWRHLLQQTSQWDGVLWGKPTAADAQSRREGNEPEGGPPGSGWAYNDVRVNLLCLALTALLGRSLPDVLAEHVLEPIGASDTWSWHGYRHSHIDLPLDTGGTRVDVVSGGAHWGGGLWMSAADLALVGRLCLGEGEQVVSRDWFARSWTPCDVKPEYGFLWWLNDLGTVFPEAPVTGRAARGNGGRHLLWVDPARALVVVSHWGEEPGRLIADVSAAVSG